MTRARHITLPEGFLAAGVKCGIKASGREDLAVIVAAERAAAALMTTSNQVVGAPVLWCRKVLPRGLGYVRGIVINAGCSNVCTGRRGLRDAEAMARQVARKIGARAEEVLVASTGVIGHFLPMAKVRRGIAAACGSLGRSGDRAVLRAIMTTDTREKSAVAHVRLGGRTVTLAGIAKGAGMIAPHLATMIAVVTTDAGIAPAGLHRAFRQAVAGTFNALTIDSDQSTSDTGVVMASGASGVSVRPGRAWRMFAAALEDVCRELAIALARDGEGATKLIVVEVTGAASAAEAQVAAKAVADSPLLKCAVHGGDPNWGRIVAALGKSAARVQPERLRVSIGGVEVFTAGRPRRFPLRAVERHLAGRSVLIAADLGLGKGRFTAYACDLSRGYVAINADYRT